MHYIKSEKYNTPPLQAKIMGPNPVKLEEELLLEEDEEELLLELEEELQDVLYVNPQTRKDLYIPF